MKTTTSMFYAAIPIAWILLFPYLSWAQGELIIGSGSPQPSAVLEVNSTTKGMLPPRMTVQQRDAIVAPAAGLTIYNSTSNCLETWDGRLWFGPCTILAAQYAGGTVFCDGRITKVIPVLNAVTGKTWMDRNLGASQVAAAFNDSDAYGDRYQWGRRADGHQCSNSSTTGTLSSSNTPTDGNFIWAPISPFDWRAPQNINLWQGVNGVNNPCPNGYRLPTEAEWNQERLSWSAPNLPPPALNNFFGAFGGTPLKLPVAGGRSNVNSISLAQVGSEGFYWSSTVNNTNSRHLHFDGVSADVRDGQRAIGLSVRCIQD